MSVTYYLLRASIVVERIERLAYIRFIVESKGKEIRKLSSLSRVIVPSAITRKIPLI